MKPKNKQRYLATLMRKKGLSINEISTSLSVSKSSVSIWVRDIKLNSSQKQRLFQKQIEGGIKGRVKAKFNQKQEASIKKDFKKRTPLVRKVINFFDHWNPNMAYVLGYFSADGYMFRNKNGSCYIGFTSTDKELLISIKQIMQIKNVIECYPSSSPNIKTKYALQIGSKQIFNRLLELGLTPNKSLTLIFPEIPINLIGHFLRGYFDGDGCAFYARYRRKNRTNESYVRHLCMRFRCGSYDFLKSIKDILSNQFNIKGGSLSFHGHAYELVYYKQNVVKLYPLLYPSLDLPFLKRKQEVLKYNLNIWGRSSVG